MVGRLGFEPRTNGLKGHCSTVELPTLTSSSTLIDQIFLISVLYMAAKTALFTLGAKWIAYMLSFFIAETKPVAPKKTYEDHGSDLVAGFMVHLTAGYFLLAAIVIPLFMMAGSFHGCHGFRSEMGFNFSCLEFNFIQLNYYSLVAFAALMTSGRCLANLIHGRRMIGKTKVSLSK